MLQRQQGPWERGGGSEGGSAAAPRKAAAAELMDCAHRRGQLSRPTGGVNAVCASRPTRRGRSGAGRRREGPGIRAADAQRRRCRRRPRRRGSHHRRTLSGTFFLVGGTGEITPAAAAPCRCEMSGAQRQRTRLRGMDWESELPPSFQLQVGSLRWMASSRTEDSDGARSCCYAGALGPTGTGFFGIFPPPTCGLTLPVRILKL